MADNVSLPAAAGKVASREVTYSGETAQAQAVGLVLFSGADDGKSASDVSASNPVPVEDSNSGNLLYRILQMLLSPLGYDKSLQRQRGTVVVESGTVTTVTTVSTVTTVTTCATVTAVTSLNALDGYATRMQVFDINRAAWAHCVRARIT